MTCATIPGDLLILSSMLSESVVRQHFSVPMINTATTNSVQGPIAAAININSSARFRICFIDFENVAAGYPPDLGHAYLASCIQQPVSTFFQGGVGNPDGRYTCRRHLEPGHFRDPGNRFGIIKIRLE